MTTTECKHCDGTGEVDTADHLDLGSIDAVRAELLSVVNGTTFGMASEHQHDRMHTLGRINFLAGRLVWLESSAMNADHHLAAAAGSSPEK